MRYICRQAAAIEAAEGTPQDVEWAIARDLERPRQRLLPPAPPGDDLGGGDARAGPAPAPAPSFDPVQYALRNVFKVPGT